jgi:hypothetical protein
VLILELSMAIKTNVMSLSLKEKAASHEAATNWAYCSSHSKLSTLQKWDYRKLCHLKGL